MVAHDHEHRHDHDPDGRAAHQHGPVRLEEADWAALAAQSELEGEVLLAFVTRTAEWVAGWRGPDAPPLQHVVDIGCGPGVGTCELARLFPDARVLAVDGSPAMLDRTVRRADELGLVSRIVTRLAELPDGLDDIDPADVIWASMALHHVGDEVAVLRRLGALLAHGGLLAVAERGDPLRVLPDVLDVGRPGLADRVEAASADWFARMRAGLADSVPSTDVASMVAAADLEVVAAWVARERLEPPLPGLARRFARGHLRRAREHFAEQFDAADLQALDVLTDADDPRGVMHRPDVFVDASRQIVIARPIGGG